MTINGYVAGPNGKNDWMTWNPDDELIAFMNSLIDSSDTLLLGRKTADSIINYWENALDKNPDTPFAKKIVDIAPVQVKLEMAVPVTILPVAPPRPICLPVRPRRPSRRWAEQSGHRRRWPTDRHCGHR